VDQLPQRGGGLGGPGGGGVVLGGGPTGQRADARHSPRPWRTSPPFDGLKAELSAGAALDHPLFPVVWPT
jgi:hypothetical protein